MLYHITYPHNNKTIFWSSHLIEQDFNAIKKPGWYMYSMANERPITNLEPFKYCPWCAKKLAKPNL
jgi:hypothetical protein